MRSGIMGRDISSIVEALCFKIQLHSLDESVVIGGRQVIWKAACNIVIM